MDAETSAVELPVQPAHDPSAVEPEEPGAATAGGTASTGRFIWHFVEMLIAMVIGMMALAPLWSLATDALGWSAVFDRPDVSALVMATNMAAAMALWMRYRRHTWVSIAEMSAAMYVPFVALLIPLWLGVLSGDALHMAGHLLMIPCMLAAMLYRRAEYAHDHRRYRAR